jgi:heat shock protein HslJ
MEEVLEMNRNTRIGLGTLVVVIVSAVMLAGCYPPANLSAGGGSAMPQGSLHGSEWQLLTVGGAPAIAGYEATMMLTQGRVTGTTGCNRYTGSYTLPARDALEFGPIASTMMACSDPQMEQERAFLKALEGTRYYARSEGSLTLKGANGEELATFEPRKSTGLVGTTWSATGINNGRQAVVSLAAGSTVTAIFDSGGRVSGSGGCNSYSAGYTVDGNKIKIDTITQTEMACLDQKIMEQEQAYFAALQKATTYRIDGDKLELRDDGGALQVGFRAEK